MKRSKSWSRLARSSFRFLFSAIRACFRFRSSWRACSCFSRSPCSCVMRATISSCGLESWCSGWMARNSSTGINGRDRYEWLQGRELEPNLRPWAHQSPSHAKRLGKLTHMIRTRRFPHSDASAHSTGSEVADATGLSLGGPQP